MQARFLADVLRNRHNAQILERWASLHLKDGWLVAGCLFQTVWNVLSGQAPEGQIKDYDFFYFDAQDLSATGERAVQAHVEGTLADLGITVEVVNQARVHCWYEAHFGHPCAPLNSAKDGIDRFLMPATCVGINVHEVYAPHGLGLLYEGTLTMNPLTPHEPLFAKKAASYQRRWPWLRIVGSPGVA
ncbi:MAG: nucleotidyltransferase family protein [Rubrivivax sp.]|nr:MAG: nucleotidyltransferase family protein [Rubrivivax sp.]